MSGSIVYGFRKIFLTYTTSTTTSRKEDEMIAAAAMRIIMPASFYVVLLLTITPQLLVSGFSSFQNRIPNGNKVVNPCNTSSIWISVGHQRSTQDGRLNQFGLDFLAAGKSWQAVCKLDSDGDGRTNGEELGDPNCIWQNNNTTILPNITGQVITHPGVCEPIGITRCSDNNFFLARNPECVSALAAITTVPPPKQPVPSWCPNLQYEDFRTLTLSFNNLTIPPQETYYLCQQYSVPIDTDYHIIAWEPLIVNQDVVHHIMLFVCDDPPSVARLTEIGGYIPPRECGMMPACQTMLFSWGFGQPNRCYDPSVGVAMGKTKYSIAILQILYTNPSKQTGLTDSSGIRLYYTNRLRPNENAMLLVGQEALAIPPQSSMKSFAGRSFATPACSQKRLGVHDRYNVTGVLFHMHKLGVYGRLSIIKGSTAQKIDIINGPTSYGNRSLIRVLSSSENFFLEPGDNIEIECQYDSTLRNAWTFYGPSADDEMCFAFIDLYPKPAERLFQIIDSVGRIDQCMLEEGKIGNCNLGEFYTVVGRIMKGNGGGFVEHCGCSIFPATACTVDCWTFLIEWNMLYNPCLTEENGMAFHVATRWAVPLPGDSLNVLSQISKCIGLTKPPSADRKCANNPDQPLTITPLPFTNFTITTQLMLNMTTANMTSAQLQQNTTISMNATWPTTTKKKNSAPISASFSDALIFIILFHFYANY